MRLRNVIREDIRRSVARKMPHLDNAGSDLYDTVELTPDVIEELEQVRPERRAVKVMPNASGGGIKAAIDLLIASHPLTGSTSGETGGHAFEMLNVDEEIGFQFVMSEPTYAGRLSRQLENFYPDSHVETSELPNPDVLPLYEGMHLGGAHLEFRKQASAKEQKWPFRHIDVEGFENDPLGSISREMIGERESPSVTNVAIQVMFQPLSHDWYKGGILDPSVDKAADHIKKKQNQSSTDWGAIGRTFTSDASIFDVFGQNEGSETDASKAVRNQRGHKGFSINIRILAVGEDPEEVVSRVDDTADMYIGYYDSDTEQGFQTVPHSGKELLQGAQLAYRREFIDRKMQTDERGASAVVHLPNKNSNTANVTFSHTTNAGDVPPDSDRFAEWDQTGWETPDRSVTMDPEQWDYAITQRQPTTKEKERARRIEEREARGEDVESEVEA